MDDDPRMLEWPENDSAESKRVFVETLSAKIGDAKWLYFAPYPAVGQTVRDLLSDSFGASTTIQGGRYPLTSWVVPRGDIAEACYLFFGHRFPELLILTTPEQLCDDALSKAFEPSGTTTEQQMLCFDDNVWIP